MKKLKLITSICCAIILILINLNLIRVTIYSSGSWIAASIVTFILLVLVYGLFRQLPWALRSTAYVFILFAIILPIGILNPFTAGDYLAAGKNPPDVKLTLLWLIPLEVLFVASAYILDSKKLINEK